MLLYVIIVMIIISIGLYITINQDPVTVEKDFDRNVNERIISSIIDYTIDKKFFETEGEGIKKGWYSLGYYLDGSNEQNNDTVKLEYLGEAFDDSTFSKIGAYHPKKGGLSQFINGEDNSNSFAVQVIEEAFDQTGEGTQSGNLYKVEIKRIQKNKNGGYKIENIYTYYK